MVMGRRLRAPLMNTAIEGQVPVMDQEYAGHDHKFARWITHQVGIEY